MDELWKDGRDSVAMLQVNNNPLRIVGMELSQAPAKKASTRSWRRFMTTFKPIKAAELRHRALISVRWSSIVFGFAWKYAMAAYDAVDRAQRIPGSHRKSDDLRFARESTSPRRASAITPAGPWEMSCTKSSACLGQLPREEMARKTAKVAM